MRTAFLFLLVTSVGPASSAATVVVSPNGPVSTLQAGIDAAAAGDTIVVKAGVYPGVATIGVAKAGLTIKAAGKVVIDARGPGGAAVGEAIRVEAADVTLRGLIVRNADTDATDPGDGIHVTGARVRIEQCVVRHCDRAGIHLAGVDALVRDCTLLGNSTGVEIDEAHGARVEKCVLRANERSLECTDANDVVATKLDIRDGGSDDCLRVQGGANFSLEKSKIFDCAGIAGSFGSDNTTIRDVVARRVLGGIEVTGAGTVVEDIEISDFRNNMTGVLLDASNCTVSDVRVRNTQAEGFIVASGASGCVLRDCIVVRSGLLVATSFLVLGANATLDACRSTSSGDDGFLIEGDGAALIDCIAIDSPRDGFDVESGSDGATLSGCVARDCRGEGFDVSGTNVTLAGCVAKKNRIDFANDGTLAQSDITFTTGGAATAPEID